MILETKGCAIELKDLSSSKREVAFYFSNFGSKDNHNHIVQKGAFTKSAQESLNRVKHFRNHNMDENFGKIISIEEDSKGAYAVSKIKRGASGDQMITDYEDGIITEHSFGAYPVKQQKLDDGIILKQEYRLMEVSSLDNWGANENTPLISIKSISKGMFDLDRFFDLVKNTEITRSEYKDLKSKFKDIVTHLDSLAFEEPAEVTRDVKRAEIEATINEIKAYKFI